MTSKKRTPGAFDDVWANYKLPTTKAPLREGAKGIDPAVGKAWKPTKAAQETKKKKTKPAPKQAKRNPSISERIQESGGLGMTDDTKRWLGTDARGPLGVLNKAFAEAVDVPVKALELAGHATDWLAQEADNSFDGSAADNAIADAMGVHMRPSELIGGLPEAFPIDGAFGAPHPPASAATRFAKSKLGEAATEAKGVIGDVLRDEQGAVPRKLTARERAKLAPEKREPPQMPYRATHDGARGIDKTDVSRWATNPFTPREERARKGKAPDRSYFGLQEGPGVTRPYQKEGGTGSNRYETWIEPDSVYNANGDNTWITEALDALPQEGNKVVYDGKPMDRASAMENLIKDQGYKGYVKTDESLGDTAQLFEDQKVYPKWQLPMYGAPSKAKIDGEWVPFGPDAKLRTSMKRYRVENALGRHEPQAYRPVDEAFHGKVADAYANMKHDPTDPDVAEAYGALKREVGQQYKRLVDDGYSFGFMDPENDPYPNPWQASQDLRDNKQMQVYPTEAGFGSGDGLTPEMIADNPLLEQVDGVTWGGKPVTYNDLFRAVHDAYGHAKEGLGFRAKGENGAYLQHLPSFSPPAQRALATETLGQNSWLNYGPHGDHNRTASVADTIFADQKTGLLPDDMVFGGQAGEFMPDPRSSSYGFRGALPDKSGGESFGRIRDTDGLKKLLAERGMLPKETKLSDGAPAIINPPKVINPDYGYAPRFTKLRNGEQAEDVGFNSRRLQGRKMITPEDLYGGWIIPGQADRTRAGGVLQRVNDWDLTDGSMGVKLQGGMDYMRDQGGAPKATWASAPGPMGMVHDKARQLDGPVYYAPFTMQGDAGDYTTMMSQAIVNAMRNERITPEMRTAFDEALRERYPDFVGLSDEGQKFALKSQLAASGGLRKDMAKMLDKAKWRNQGYPDIGMLREAITEPDLKNAPTEAFGYNIGQIDTSKPLRETGINGHETYKTELPGSYMGSMGVQVPVNIMLPDFFKQAMDEGAARPDIAYRLKRGVKVQKADQEWLDGIMPYFEWAQSDPDLNW